MQHDYNGAGRWSRAAILARYGELARRLRIEAPADLRPLEVTAAGERWIYPVMMRVIEGIERGDAACVELGIAFIEEDSPFPFGRVLKSNTARALRRAALTPEQQERIRRRVVAMLVAGNTPREYREYAKLVRRIGVGNWWAQAEGRLNLTSPYVRRYYNYFKQHVLGNEPSAAAPNPAT
ncbi:hypothetical protein GobsT_13400 [Gemmata obscuriglobus]|nr:hypothetical protein GobsT_13400 [Gemmata obscuriglobus]VTS02080.1 Uncharacterized protein OS=Granulicella mallensis (strain ATCC BAA-1857 / DSM 23137 / MP5ACTX8) GN=AciX8_4598 PE=4 SV=1 [Gemmata obscuriglobus UQM 2246]